MADGRSFARACASLSLFAASAAFAAPGSLTVNVNQPGVRISPSLYGIFFEEINNAGDGGIYAEMLRNRNFEESTTKPDHWSIVQSGAGTKGDVSIVGRDPSSAPKPDFDLGNIKGPYNLHSLRLTAETIAKGGRVGAANDGYWGVNVEKGKSYKLVVRATKSKDGNASPKLIATLENRAGEVFASESVEVAATTLQDAKGDGESATSVITLKATGTDPNARLVLALDQPGTVDVDYVSLMPADTVKGQGLRSDLFDKLQQMKPAFVRFPGGCWVEGDTMQTSSNWKRTIGPLPERWTQPNLWGYDSTNGLGYHEYLQMCEDLGADALFVFNVGMSHHGVVPMDQMPAYVQDALDAIEYALDPVDSKWGKLRADAGHPAPFPLKLVEIGNENGGPRYYERYALFYDAIHAKYPDLKLIANDWQNGRPQNRPIQILDEHYYNSPQFFFRNATKYDTYDRAGHKVYVGEYAVTQGCGGGNLIAAVGEAAFMTGMERNSDVVVMASYAPLFAQVNGKRWNPDAINYDNARSYGTPSYYVQSMFANNRGDVVLPTTIKPATNNDVADAQKLKPRHGAAGIGTWDTQAEFKDFTVTTPDGKVVYNSADAKGSADGWETLGANGWQHRADGTIVQTSSDSNLRTLVGDRAWTDYTVNVKARKTDGKEGFLVLARAADEENFVWLNIGGWGNDHTGFERAADGGKEGVGKTSDFKVETGKWYDVKLVVKGDDITGFVDGKEVASAKDVPSAAGNTLFSTASRDEASGDVIVKVVNGSAAEQPLNVKLDGITTVSGPAKMWTLTGKPTDENSIDAPERVVPREETVKVGSDGAFAQTFPAYSVTILRVPAGK